MRLTIRSLRAMVRKQLREGRDSSKKQSHELFDYSEYPEMRFGEDIDFDDPFSDRESDFHPDFIDDAPKTMFTRAFHVWQEKCRAVYRTHDALMRANDDTSCSIKQLEKRISTALLLDYENLADALHAWRVKCCDAYEASDRLTQLLPGYDPRQDSIGHLETLLSAKIAEIENMTQLKRSKARRN